MTCARCPEPSAHDWGLDLKETAGVETFALCERHDAELRGIIAEYLGAGE